MMQSFLLSIFSLLTLSPYVLGENVDYDYFKKGADWTGLCANKQSPMQSPIDLNKEAYVQDDFGDMQMMMWQESFFGVHLYDGSFHDTVKLNFTKGKLTFLDVDGNMSYYKFTEFHIHSPSDHTFNGKHYNVEMHLVHSLITHDPTKSEEAVVAIFFDTSVENGRAHPFIESLNLKTLRTQHDIVVDEIPLMQLTQQMSTQQIINYKGSLTKPPCTEDVLWIILPTPLHMSQDQLNEFNDMWSGNSEFANGNGNNRETIPLNGRKIYTKGILAA